jgi:hypothetical protein
LSVTSGFGRRHVLRIAFGRARIDPANDRVDLRVAQRHVVLEIVDADAHVDMPRRHLTRDDTLLDGTCPRARILIRDQRHRRDRIRLMALLTLVLENGRDVFAERHGPRSGISGLSDHRHRATAIRVAQTVIVIRNQGNRGRFMNASCRVG